MLQGRINDAGGSATQLFSSNAGYTLQVGATADSTASLYITNSGDIGSSVYAIHTGAGTAVYGRAFGTADGVRGQSIRTGVHGVATDQNDSAGVVGTSPDVGVYGDGTRTGIVGFGGQVGGLFLSLEGAAMRLQAGDLATVPQQGTWETGDIVMTSTGEAWLCTGNGRGDWRLLGSQASAGAFVPLTPTRVYDSRSAQPDGGRILTGGSQRTIDVGFERDLNTGAPIRRVIPLGTRAIAANVTITGTTGSGFVALTPGIAQNYSASAINWTAPNTTLANGLILTTDTLVQLKAWTVGGNTKLIIDVTGYYAQA